MMTSLFEIEFDQQTLVGDTMGPEMPRTVLMLHGAGQSRREKMLPLRNELLEKGIGSVAFDFIGHGETGGEMQESSLESRTCQACRVIDQLDLAQKPLSIVAASMGAYNAVQLTAEYVVRHLILIVPAMYTDKADDVRFGDRFSDLIRVPFSWRDSAGWNTLRRYTGNLLVVAAEIDRVIPREIVERYYDAAENAETRRLVTIKDTGHMIFTELREKKPREMGQILDIIEDTISL